MSEKTETTRKSNSKRDFRVGDCIILNDIEQPCGRLVVVVTNDAGDFYHCQYLNADPDLDSFNNPPMKAKLNVATKVEEFGVEIRAHDGFYWCEKVGESNAKYPDGKPRKWQESFPIKYIARPEIAELLWPF